MAQANADHHACKSGERKETLSKQKEDPLNFVRLGNDLINLDNVTQMAQTTHNRNFDGIQVECIEIGFVGQGQYAPSRLYKGESGFDALVMWINEQPALAGAKSILREEKRA